MASGISFVKVVDAGPGWTKVEASDGNTYTFDGDRNWRNNNPGNIEYGAFAKAHGAIGTDGRFAVFPDVQTGQAAQTTLQFNTSRYANKSITDAISSYAPSNENNSAAYAAALAESLGVSPDTKLSDLTPDQQAEYVAAQRQVEGGVPGTIKGEKGQPVDQAIVQQFNAPALPPENIPSFNPLPAPAPLTPASMQSAAANNVLTSLGANFRPASVLARTQDISVPPLPVAAGSSTSPVTAPMPAVAPVPMPGRPVALGTTPAVPATSLTPALTPAEIHARLMAQQTDQRYTGPTVVGGVIGQIVGDAAKNAMPAVNQAVGDTVASIGKNATQAGDTIRKAASNVGNTLGGMFSGALGMFGQPASVAPTAANSSGSPDDRGTISTTYRPVITPAPAATLKAGQATAAGGSIVTQAQQNAFGGLGTPAPQVAPTPAPYPIAAPVQQPKQQQVVQPAPTPKPVQTITGSATGRAYVVGNTYSNANGKFVAQANGTFKKVA